MKLRIFLVVGMLIVGGLFSNGKANAEERYPSKSVRLVVPFVPGGATDIVARLTAKGLGERWGQNVIVDNRAGASGTIGAEIVAKAAPDGHSPLFASGSVLTVNQHLYKNLPFDTSQDLTGVINVATGPMVIITAAGTKATSLEELIVAANVVSSKLTFGSAGVGTQVHLAAEKVAHAAKINSVHIPYKGEGAAVIDVAFGQVDWAALNLAAVIGFVKDGKLRALAVTSRARTAVLPSTPTVSEVGLPAAENVGWFGIAAPSRLPLRTAKAIHDEIGGLITEPAFRDRLTTFGMTLGGDTIQVFREAILSDTISWGQIIADRKITIQ